MLQAHSVPSQTQLLSLEISYGPSDDILSSTIDFAKPNNLRLIENRYLMTTVMSFPTVSPELLRKRRRRKGDYIKPGMASSSTVNPSPRFINSFGQPGEAQLPGMGSHAPGICTLPLPTPSCSYFSIDETSSIYDSMTLYTQTGDSGQELLINPWTNNRSNNERANLDLVPGDALFLPQDSSIMHNDYPFEPDLTAESSWITNQKNTTH
jgi:hypothetical protein